MSTLSEGEALLADDRDLAMAKIAECEGIMKSGYLREGAWATVEPSMRLALAIARGALDRLVSSDARLGQAYAELDQLRATQRR